MEYFDIYDKFGNFLNKTATRGSKLNEGEYYTVIHVWIKNKDGLFLIQKRNKKTDIILHQWATTSGAVIKGETSILSAKREVFEELGITVKEESFTLLNRYFVKDSYASYIVDVYYIEANILIKDMVLDKLEVSDVKYTSLNEIKKMIKSNHFWNYPKMIKQIDYFDLLEKS